MNTVGKGLLYVGAVLAIATTGSGLAVANSEIALYAWGPGISGDATLNGTTRDFDISFNDLLDHTEFALMGHFESRGERWGGGVDLAFVELEDESRGIDLTVDFGIYEGFATYRLGDHFDLLGGVRFTDFDIEADAPGIPPARSDGEQVDGFVGVRLLAPMGDAFEASLRADIGGGDSDQVVNAFATLRWHVSSSVVLSAGYRWIEYEYEGDRTNLGADFDVTLDGFVLGVSYRF